MIKTLSYHKDEVFGFCSFTGEVSSCSFQGCNLAAKADYLQLLYPSAYKIGLSFNPFAAGG